MAKHKKTRKQKMLADLRRTTIHPVAKEPDSTTYSIPIQKTHTEPIPAPVHAARHIGTAKSHVTSLDYRYLPGDLRKTVLLTIFIIVFEIVIKFTVKGI